MQELTKTVIEQKLKTRSPGAHKGDHGHVLLVAGSKGSMGAAIIAARACLRSGSGLVTVSAPESERAILQISIPEAMVTMRESAPPGSERFTTIALGPGLGTTQAAKEVLLGVLQGHQKPMVIDADALNLISGDKALLTHLPEGSILTPHPKEFDRLFGHHDSEEQRVQTAARKAEAHNIVIVLKGQRTKVTFGGQTAINTSGNAGLAKGGSGDALTGIIAALLAQGYTSFDAAQCGVYLHGVAADLALQTQSVESMLITDVIECLGQAFNFIRS